MQNHQYRNAMELLVEAEVECQLQKLTPQSRADIRTIEVTTYALNRLPALYASSEKGLSAQLQRGKTEHRDAIRKAVRWAINVVQKDPLRQFEPLQQSDRDAILDALRHLLDDESLTWEGLLDILTAKLEHQDPSQSNHLSSKTDYRLRSTARKVVGDRHNGSKPGSALRSLHLLP